MGYDINARRIEEINNGFDSNLTPSQEDLKQDRQIVYSNSADPTGDADIYIVTAPTPVNDQNQPDLAPLLTATELVAEHLRPGNLVIFESTVYPGATEEECVPALAQRSGLRFNEDFFVGYSPERINPGDSAHSIGNTVKVTSGSSAKAAAVFNELYAGIIQAGIFRASSIKVAEAAEVIENTQRDLNIALGKERCVLFDFKQLFPNDRIDGSL